MFFNDFKSMLNDFSMMFNGILLIFYDLFVFLLKSEQCTGAELTGESKSSRKIKEKSARNIQI